MSIRLTPILDRQPASWVLLAAVALYSLVGFYGALWVSDEWDLWRAQMMAFLGVPGLGLFYTLHTYLKGWHRPYPKMHLALLVGIFVAMGTGWLSLFNGLTGQDQRKVAVFMAGQSSRTSLETSLSRGGLGLLYRKRW